MPKCELIENLGITPDKEIIALKNRIIDLDSTMILYVRDLGLIHTYGSAGVDPTAMQYSITDKIEHDEVEISIDNLYNNIIDNYTNVIFKLSHINTALLFLLSRLILNNINITIHWYSDQPPTGILASKLVIFLRDFNSFKNRKTWLTELKEHDIIVLNSDNPETLNNLIIRFYKDEIKASLWYNKLFISDADIIKNSKSYPNLLTLYPYTLGA